ncbi:hypothetical protein BAX94_06185 [Elizabethkingia meningoseptica]|uniref:Uncharacterized protein n=2 Tax=Weeksellaceae TaxID=2762318 RepID=A0A1V3U1G0_ELIME|nr:hypothetical protein [Elizabethkingia meningoseptica]MDX8574174.1 hypothetical protein [Elizabethkingia sp. HX WYD]AQX13668.1 hypothetical protein BBD35_15375 [Elizabethkingia meningoseptica]MBG0515459.1 hypothetical protein [Elizabethkingia meningoseptica]MDE5434174.1 hypothetical protein [Elizabethkingia meningoseptica]MDE5448773.1 hypothetical protein [Elizabethkingia meningoseptica]
MWKIIGLCLIFLLSSNIYSQNKERFQYVKIGNMEGTLDAQDFDLIGGKIRYMQLLEEFEKKFSKIKNGYPDYYRDYDLYDSFSLKLIAKLIPKRSVPVESKRKYDFFDIPINTKIFKVYYNINTKKIDGIIETSSSIIE